jgi:polar amino acid transport system permease protein
MSALRHGGLSAMRYGLQFRDVFAAWESLLDGIWITLALSASAMAGGFAIGVACAAGRVYGPPLLRWMIGAYVEVIRNTPLLVQLFLVYFGLPSLGLRFDGLTAAILTLTVNLGAYTTEIVRAGLEAVPKAQVEAGLSLGLSGLQVFRYVVVFPALKAMFPALASQFVLLMLATSVASQISVEDLFHAASIVQSRTFRDFEVYIEIGVLYLALAFLFRALFGTIHHLVFVRR